MIKEAALGSMTFIAEGGVGSVYRVPDLRVPGFTSLAYKRIKDPAGNFTAAHRQEALDAIARSVAFRDGLSPADRDDLDEYTVWPIDLVQDANGPCGCIMPLLSEDYFLTTYPQGKPQGQVVFELSWLSAKESQIQAMGIDRSAVRDIAVRVTVLAQLVYAVGRLHRHGAVYGDVSLKNAAVAVDPPRIKLLDCDAAAAQSDPTRKQMHSPFFAPPECAAGTSRLQDDRTDIYKLGLCVIRGLQQGPGVTQAKDPQALAGTLDAAAIAVLARAVGADRDARPTAKELFDCLKRVLSQKAAPPEIQAVSLGKTAMLRGTDVEVCWSVTGAKRIRIRNASGLDDELASAGDGPAQRFVTPRASGEITVEAINDHGSVEAVAGVVQLFELPAFDVQLDGILPRPQIGGLPGVEVPQALRSMPPIPVVSTSEHEVPRVQLPELEPLRELTAVMQATAPPLDGLEAVHAPVLEMAGVLQRAAADMTPDGSMGRSVEQSFVEARRAVDGAWMLLRLRLEDETTTDKRRRTTP